MIRRSTLWSWAACLVLLSALALPAGTYKLNSGLTITGEPIAPNADGIIIKLDSTRFSDRVAWTNFNEASLRELANDNAIKPFVARYLFDEEDEITLVDKIRPTINVNQPDRVAAPPETGFLGALFGSAVGLLLLAVFYAANLFAGYQVGAYRGLNTLVSIGASAILPVLAPIIILSIPAPGSGDGYDDGYVEEELGGELASSPAEAAAPAEAAPAPAAPAAAIPKPTVYERGKFTFNRRFFETKLAGFLRTVPSEEDKDLVLVVESARGSQTATRIARIMPNEVCLLVSKGGASAEVPVPFSEIKTVTVKHRGA